MSDGGNENRGIVLNIQKMSIHDGPGIRSTVFFKGCPLSCLWCSNPESQRVELEIACAKTRCIKCGYCHEVCPQQIIENGGNYTLLDRNKCDLCLKCVEECCTNSKKVIGQSYTLTELYEEIIKDKAFYDSSGGGVTFSGGEPFMQAEFLLDMLRLCKENGLHTAVETTGLADPAQLVEALSDLDLVYYDLKQMDDETHQQITGVANGKILENLALVAKQHDNVVVRIPVVPGLNDSEENIRATADYVAELGLPLIELLPYHSLGENKYEQLGRTYALTATKEPSSAQMEQLAEAARAAVGSRQTQIEIMKSM